MKPPARPPQREQQVQMQERERHHAATGTISCAECEEPVEPGRKGSVLCQRCADADVALPAHTD
jgi:hypothetical protein